MFALAAITVYILVFHGLAAYMNLGMSGRERKCLDATTPGASCEVHGNLLLESVVWVNYGLSRGPSQERLDAMLQRYPHACSPYPGGGCVQKEPSLARVSFCPKCREAEATWNADHEGAW